jgi:type I restriction enzyme S subunit
VTSALILPEGWLLSSIGEVCSRPQYGWTTAASKSGGNVKLLRTTDITHGVIDWARVPYCSEVPDCLEAYQLRENDIVISRAGSVGASYLLKHVPTRAVFASYLIRFRTSPEVAPSFISYFLKSSQYWSSIADRSAGIAVPNVNASKLGDIKLPIAPFEEQVRVVAKLDEVMSDLDAGVASLDRARANLKRYRAAMLKAAVEGRLTADWRAKNPPTESGADLLARLLRERRARWEQTQIAKFEASGKTAPKGWRLLYVEPATPDATELPRLPDGWCWATPQVVGEVLLGRQRAPQFLTGRFAQQYLRVANIKDDRIDFSDLETMDFDATHFEKYKLVPGDILVSEGQSPELVGQSAIYLGFEKPLCFQKTLHRFRARPAVTTAEFAQLVFRSHVRNGVFRKLASITTNIAHLTLEKFEASPFPLPPIDEQAEISARCDAQLTSTFATEREIEASLRRASSLRQAILKRAFSGELVPQDPDDEPASALLERIRASRVGVLTAKPKARGPGRRAKA